jgi:hypothetical protein
MLLHPVAVATAFQRYVPLVFQLKWLERLQESATAMGGLTEASDI